MTQPPHDSSANPLRALGALGQSVWLDFIRRDLIDSGALARLVREDGVAGVTSNPAIFEKAIAAGAEYAEPIARARERHGLDPRAIYEELAVDDIRRAADVLAPVHVATRGADGFVSLEVSPELAHDAAGTVREAHRLWAAVDRPNLMIKVPATIEGIGAIRELLAAGIHVNITLLFARSAYAAVADAWLEALETRLGRGEPIDRIGSVASFFVSRIDSLVDKRIDERLATLVDEAARERLAALRGTIAIANAKLAYRHFQHLRASSRWRRLADAGALPQRLLWASTSTKNPSYRDTLYVEELAGPETVNTVPPETIEAFRDHGVARASLGAEIDLAERRLAELEAFGISLDRATDELLADGLVKFVQPFRAMLAAVERRARELAGSAA